MSTNQNERLRSIKGVLFDVDGTLYSQTPLRLIMIFVMFLLNFFRPRRLKRQIKVISEYRKAQEALRSTDELLEGMPARQIELASKNSFESSNNVLEIKKEWFDSRPLPFLRFCRRRGLKHFLQVLKKHGFKLGVFSDYPAHDKLQALGISHYFSTVISSNNPEVKGFKPMTNGFAKAAEMMGLEPTQILYIGDRPEVDGKGASAANMPVIILNGLFKRKDEWGCTYAKSLYEIAEKLLGVNRDIKSDGTL